MQLPKRDPLVTKPWRRKSWHLEAIRWTIRRLRLARVMFRTHNIIMGSEVLFARGADIQAPHFIRIGSKVWFGKNFYCETDVIMGSHILISSNVSFVGRDHPFESPDVTVYDAPRVDGSLVEIGDNVLIGFGSIIIGSVKIGSGCIVGAGSVVTKDLPNDTICAGVPARAIRPRYPSI